MQLLHSLGLLVLLSCDALAAPTSTQPQQQPRSFKVAGVRRNDFVPHGPTALHTAFQKYGIVPRDSGLDLPDYEPLPQTKRSTGSVTATLAKGGSEFVCPVKVGGQEVLVNFDTGSSDMWLINTKLPPEKTKGHNAFDPSKSTSWKPMEGASFKSNYGDSSYASGDVGTDTVNIGGATVEKQSIGLPTDISESFAQDTSSNGLVGLAFSKVNTVKPEKQKSFFENAAGSLDEPVMTAHLNGNTGEYEFGTVDHSKYQGDLKKVSVDSSSGFWQFQSGKFAVGDGNTDMQDMKTPNTIADTGTSLMLVSPEAAKAYYAQVKDAVPSKGAGGYVYPCDTKLPSFSVDIGGQGAVTIPGSVITFSQAGTNGTTGQPLCFGGIQSNQGSNLQIYGDTFLKAAFVVFDQRGPSLGIAAAS